VVLLLQKKAGLSTSFHTRDFAMELKADPVVVLTSYPACAVCGTHSHFKSACPKATKLIKAPCYEVQKTSVVPAKPEKKSPEAKAAAPSTSPAQKKKKQPPSQKQVATSSQVKEEPPEASSSKGKKRASGNPSASQVGL